MTLLSLPYVDLRTQDGRVWIVTSDAELHDYLDDYLTEVCDLTCEYAFFGRAAGGTHCIVLPSEISLEQASALLVTLDPKELERIYKLNNSPA